jgi:hypothetical protein
MVGGEMDYFVEVNGMVIAEQGAAGCLFLGCSWFWAVFGLILGWDVKEAARHQEWAGCAVRKKIAPDIRPFPRRDLTGDAEAE